MSQSTVYDVKLLYNVSGNAPQGLQSIGKQAEQVEKSTSSLGGALKALGATLVGGMAISKGKELFIDFNAEIENSKIGIAAIAQMFSPSTTWGKAMGDAEELFGRYQQAAVKSTATTRQFIEMHKMLAPSFSASGLQDKLEGIVKGSTVAAPLLGMQADMFARDLDSMLRGNVNVKDRGALLMIKALGMDTGTFNDAAKENVGFAVDAIERALAQLTGGGALTAMEGSFSGVMSTLQDMAQILSGKAGKELFTAITVEIRSWNEWLTANDWLVKAWVHDVGQGLLSGFRAVKSVIATIVEHKSALMAIAGVWLSLRGISSGASGIAGLATGASSLVQSLMDVGKSSTGVVGVMGNVAIQGAKAAGALGATYIAAQAFADWVDKEQRRTVVGAGDLKALQSYLPRALMAMSDPTAVGAVRSFAKGAGAIGKDGAFNGQVLAQYLASGGTAKTEALQTAMLVGKVLLQNPEMRRFGPELPPTDPLKTGAAKDPPKVNVNIQRVEVASDDPDRFVRGLVDIADKALNRPTQALSAHRI